MHIQLTPGEPLYLITLSNYATPSFITANTQYAGTRAVLDHFFDVLDKENQAEPPGATDWEGYEKTIVKQYRRYQAGGENLTFYDAPLIRPITLLHLTEPMETAPLSFTESGVKPLPLGMGI